MFNAEKCNISTIIQPLKCHHDIKCCIHNFYFLLHAVDAQPQFRGWFFFSLSLDSSDIWETWDYFSQTWNQKKKEKNCHKMCVALSLIFYFILYYFLLDCEWIIFTLFMQVSIINSINNLCKPPKCGAKMTSIYRHTCANFCIDMGHGDDEFKMNIDFIFNKHHQIQSHT